MLVPLSTNRSDKIAEPADFAMIPVARYGDFFHVNGGIDSDGAGIVTAVDFRFFGKSKDASNRIVDLLAEAKDISDWVPKSVEEWLLGRFYPRAKELLGSAVPHFLKLQEAGLNVDQWNETLIRIRRPRGGKGRT